MFDELLDIFDRDRQRTRPRRGIRGLLDRLSGGDSDHRDRRHDAWDDDDTPFATERAATGTARRERDRRRREPLDWDI